MESLPHSVIAAGWVPFTIVSLLPLFISTLFVLWNRSSRSQHRAPGSSAIAVLGLSPALMTSSILLILLISYMKNYDGSWQPWAQSSTVREALENSILWAYYTAYGGILVFAFLLIPANFFYHGLPHQGEDGEEPPCQTKLLLSCFVFGLFAGVFLPFEGSPPTHLTFWQQFQWFLEELEASKGHDLFVFKLNTLSCIGMCLLVWRGWRVEELEASIREVEARGEVGRFEQSQIDRLQQQVRLLKREQRDLEQRARTVVNRCKQVFRPFQVGVGLVLSLLSLLLATSLTLTSVDKALHSSLSSGYSLQNSSLPNPLDIVLVAAQQIFPLDYVLYIALVVFLVCSSTAGLTSLGIRCCCLQLYRIRAWKTPPRGLLCAVLALMYIIIAQNVVIFSLVPDYTMFGNQHYNSSGTIVRCQARDLPLTKDLCVPSRISALLLAFHSKTWLFGAVYYWLTWALLGSIVLGFLHRVWLWCRPSLPEEITEDLIDSDEDEERAANPFD